MPWVATSQIREETSFDEDELGNRNYTQSFLVQFNTTADGPLAAAFAPGVPRRKSQYNTGFEFDTFAYCVRRTVKPAPDSSFKVTCSYTTDTRPELYPWQEPPRISTSYTKIELPLERKPNELDDDDEPLPLLNTAGDKFDPAYKQEFPILIIRVSANVLAPPATGTIINTVNESAIWGKAAKTLKCSAFDISQEYVYLDQSSQPIPFYAINAELEYNALTWTEQLVSQGMRQRNDDGELVEIKDDDDERISTPVLLDENGHWFKNPDSQTLGIIEFDPCILKDFSVFGLNLDLSNV